MITFDCDCSCFPVTIATDKKILIELNKVDDNIQPLLKKKNVYSGNIQLIRLKGTVTRKGSVMETLRKKAKGTKFTPSQLKRSYDKGLAAYASSGSRKGMSSHQWAMARVNSVLRGGKARAIDFPKKKKKKGKK